MSNQEGLENAAAIAVLLAAAAQAAEAASAPEPVGDIETLNNLYRQNAEIEQKLKAQETELQELQGRLKSILDAKAELERQRQAVQAQAMRLAEVLFGRPRQVESPPTPAGTAAPAPVAAPVPKPRPLDNSIVKDDSVGVAPTRKEVDGVTRVGGFAF